VDVFSLAELPLQYYKIWQLYKPVLSKSEAILQSLVQSFLPEFFDELDSNLSFSVCPSYLLQRSLNNNNSITRFDKIQDIKFEKFGEYYDLSVLGTESYFANGIVHHNCGKSGAGAQKALFKIMNGESGLIMNPDFENLKISTWPEFQTLDTMEHGNSQSSKDAVGCMATKQAFCTGIPEWCQGLYQRWEE